MQVRSEGGARAAARRGGGLGRAWFAERAGPLSQGLDAAVGPRTRCDGLIERLDLLLLAVGPLGDLLVVFELLLLLLELLPVPRHGGRTRADAALGRERRSCWRAV
jgi:hypothetical protein